MRTVEQKAANASAQRARYAANSQLYAERNHQYYLAHRAERLAEQQARYVANRDAIEARRSARRRADPEAAHARDHARYQRRREQVLAAQRARRATGEERAKEHGLSLADYQAMLAAQDGRCAICGTVMPRPCIDHDHASGAIRGLLCFNCNVALGHLRDSVALLRAAIHYIEEGER